MRKGNFLFDDEDDNDDDHDDDYDNDNKDIRKEDQKDNHGANMKTLFFHFFFLKLHKCNYSHTSKCRVVFRMPLTFCIK